jgi:predicted transcriptional regulator
MRINGKAFKSRREQLLISSYNLSKQAGVSPSVIKSIEDSGTPRPDSVRKVITALGLTLQEAYAKHLISD